MVVLVTEELGIQVSVLTSNSYYLILKTASQTEAVFLYALFITFVILTIKL